MKLTILITAILVLALAAGGPLVRKAQEIDPVVAQAVDVFDLTAPPRPEDLVEAPEMTRRLSQAEIDAILAANARALKE